MSQPILFVCPCCGSLDATSEPACINKKKLEETTALLRATEKQLAVLSNIRVPLLDYQKKLAEIRESKAKGLPVGKLRMDAVLALLDALSRSKEMDFS
jgi:hypothetical protein